ncbi:hypothetical protein CPB86DRAFT_873045 [Serendipita vermifera]|nr:hypothetical protein CPB86DRAFT_873045 [Serendipita vermifera]
MDVAKSDVDRRAESSLFTLRNSQKEMEEFMRSWTTTAKDLEETVINLRQDLASQTSINADLRETITSLESKNLELQTALDGLLQSKSAIDHDVNRLMGSAKSAEAIIDAVIHKNKQLSSDKKLLLAKIDTLEIHLSTSEEYQQCLEEQIAALQIGDKSAVATTPTKDHVLTELNTTPKPANSQAQIESLRLSIDRLQRKFDRLNAKKESAEKKYFKSYVEWHEFKTWWKAFSQYPGVAPRVRQFNRDTRNGVLIGYDINGKLLNVPQVREDSPLFPNVEGKPHDNAIVLEESDMDPPMTIVPSPIERRDVPDSSPRSKASYESFDPEMTQETTSARSQMSIFDVVIREMDIPPLQLYSPAITNPAESTPVPLTQSPITVKDESQDTKILLKGPTTKPLTTPNDPQPQQLVSALSTTVLGKRKSPPDGGSVQPPTRTFVPLRLQHVDGSTIAESSELGKRSRGTLEEKKVRELEGANTQSGHRNDRYVLPMYLEGNDGESLHLNSPNTSINARYEINPAQNSGLNFAFDEVVRNKEARRKLKAGTCECCKDYYAAVGPLPPRLQAPLWKSPTSSPTTTSKAVQACKIHGEHRDMLDDEEDEDEHIVAHRQDVSRHRHQWARPKTPPGFWNIGFPTTQEVEAINRAAEEMHERREARIEKEANKPDGKFRRR